MEIQPEGKILSETKTLMNQPLSPKDKRITTNPSPDSAITGPSRNAMDPPRSSDPAADSSLIYPLNSYGSLEQTYFYGGYDNGASGWSGYPQFAGAESLHIVPPVMYGDNSSLGLHSPYGFSSSFGQYSPVSTPVPQIMVDNQLYSPQQIPISPQYYPQPVGTSMPHMSATIPVSHTDMVTSKGHMSANTTAGHGYYNIHGMYGSVEPLSSQSNATDSGWRTLTSTGGYTQPVAMLSSFDPTVGQFVQQRTFPGYGLSSEFVDGSYPYDSLFQSSNFGGTETPQSEANYRNHLNLEKARIQREQDTIYVISGDHNRGPRASKVKGKGTIGNGSLSVVTENDADNKALANSSITGASTSGLNLDSYNSAEFRTNHESAKFFIIKSFSEDNIHKSIKYGVWASTPHGNKKLDAAYLEAKEKGNCSVFLFFSVNASGQFCGVAEMKGAVDFDKNADYWQQDRWIGQFSVRWHIIKDVPNIKFRHILLENNDNKPVTHSRDSQEVKLEQGIEMLKIFKEYDAQTSIIDDFEFYDEREKLLQERKSRQQAKTKPTHSESISDEMLNNITERLDQSLHVEETRKDIVPNENGSVEQPNKV